MMVNPWAPSLRSLLHVPRCCDDVEVMKFLADHFIDFRSSHPNARLNADQVFAACKAKFGLHRCDSVKFWVH